MPKLDRIFVVLMAIFGVMRAKNYFFKSTSSVVPCILMALFFACNNQKEHPKASLTDSLPPKTVMAIFAHPDDETTVGPVLAKYALISDVHLVVATDGRYGINDHSGIPAGDSLVVIRKKETACACAELGINPPHFLEAKDGLGLNGKHNFYMQAAALKERIHAKIEELKPDVILTFGPDGDTGHPDHRMVGLFTTEILLRENWANAIDLYHFGWTKEQTKKFPKDWGLGYVNPNYLNTTIHFSPEEEEKAFSSLQCHKSQFSKEAFAEWIAAERADTTNVLYFRKFALDSALLNAF